MAFETTKYLIFSVEHNAWWRQNCLGYTHDISEAQIFTIEQAMRVCKDANLLCSTNGPFKEVMVPLSFIEWTVHTIVQRELSEDMQTIAREIE